MIYHSTRFNRYLLLSYSFVLILITAGAGVFIHYENSLAKSFTSYSKNAELMSHVDSILFSANERSILLVQMINTPDVSTVKSLNLKMLDYEQNVKNHLQELIQSVETQSQEDYLRQSGIVISFNRKIQAEIYQFLIDNQKQHALDQLVRIAIPVQDKIHMLFNHLKDSYQSRLRHSKEQFSNAIDDMIQVTFMVAIPIIVSLLVIAVMTTRRLNAFANSQQSILNSLEDRVKERTQELLLDQNLMHNLNEAIGIFDDNHQLHLTNKKLDNLSQACQIPETGTIWQLLVCLFKDMDVGQIKYQLKHKQAWRGEAALSQSDVECYMIDIAKINDSSLPSDYFSISLTDISDLKASQLQLEHTSHYDAVTQLPNRHFFNVTVDRFLSDQPDQPLHLIYIDLNNFKWVNDHYGHAVGDAYLLNVGIQFKKALPKDAFISRLGGDEFAILLSGAYTDIELAELCKALLQALEFVNEQQSTHQVGCSIGVVSYPLHAESAEELIHQADYAMYRAKHTTDGHYCIFTDDMKKSLLDLKKIEVNLHRAIKNKEFEVYYQPQYSLYDLKLVGAEALVRWPTPERMISPVEFIPLAERFGLINQIGDLVMQQATQQTRIWQTTPKPLPRIAINISASQLLMDDFGDAVETSLANSQLLPHQVDIEITESMMMENLELNGETEIDCLSCLQQKGLEISIDDFGTGYSSLAYIKHLNVDRIKIDKSFIDDIGSQSEARSIVRAIIEMGHSLGLKVLAEGIETPNQLDILKNLGCDEGQGYLFSKPQPSEAFFEKCLT